jgi:hypothetical protein
MWAYICTFTFVHSDSICGCKGVAGQLIVSTFCKGVAARVWLGSLLSAHYLLSAHCDKFAVSVQSGRTRSSQLELGQNRMGFHLCRCISWLDPRTYTVNLIVCMPFLQFLKAGMYNV